MALPQHFVYLQEVAPTIIQDVRYFSDNNFIGRPIKGYHAAQCIITKQAGAALAKAQEELLAKGMSFKVFDCYRPATAVQDFIAWSKVADDQKMKKIYYPNVNKADFFKLGYVAEKSGHTRGSTVDLTIVKLPEKAELGMGTPFDYMDELSHSLNPAITGDARSNRLMLRELMIKAGFEPYEFEWWHFTLKDEPFPDTYFDFPVE